MSRPLVAIAAAFALGTALGYYPVLPLGAWVALGALALGLAAACHVRCARLAGPAIAVAAVFVAAAYCAVRMLPPARDLSHLPLGKRVVVVGWCDEPVPGDRPWAAFSMSVEWVRIDGMWYRAEGHANIEAWNPLPAQLGDPIAAYGTLVEPPRATNPGQFDLRRFLRLKRKAFVSLKYAQISRPLAAPLPSPNAWGARARALIRERLRQAMPRANPTLATDLLMATAYGVRSGALPRQIVDHFRRAGTVHVLVVSGSQVTLVAFLVLMLCARSRLPLGLQVALSAAAVLGYACLAFGEASITRATIMALLLMAALRFRRDYDIVAALAAAAVLIILSDPANLFDVGFQLSVAAVVGIILFVLHWPGLTDPVPRGAAEYGLRQLWRGAKICLMTSLGAWLMTAPLIAHYFHRVSLVGIAANIVAVPVAWLMTVLGLSASAVVWLGEWAAYPLLWLASWLGELLVRSAAWFANLPGACLERVTASWPAIFAWWAVVVGGHRAAVLWLSARRAPGHNARAEKDLGDG